MWPSAHAHCMIACIRCRVRLAVSAFVSRIGRSTSAQSAGLIASSLSLCITKLSLGPKLTDALLVRVLLHVLGFHGCDPFLTRFNRLHGFVNERGRALRSG